MIKRTAKYACSVVAIVGLALSLHGHEIRTSEKGLLLTGNAEYIEICTFMKNG